MSSIILHSVDVFVIIMIIIIQYIKGDNRETKHTLRYSFGIFVISMVPINLQACGRGLKKNCLVFSEQTNLCKSMSCFAFP